MQGRANKTLDRLIAQLLRTHKHWDASEASIECALDSPKRVQDACQTDGNRPYTSSAIFFLPFPSDRRRVKTGVLRLRFFSLLFLALSPLFHHASHGFPFFLAVLPVISWHDVVRSRSGSPIFLPICTYAGNASRRLPTPRLNTVGSHTPVLLCTLRRDGQSHETPCPLEALRPSARFALQYPRPPSRASFGGGSAPRSGHFLISERTNIFVGSLPTCQTRTNSTRNHAEYARLGPGRDPFPNPNDP